MKVTEQKFVKLTYEILQMENLTSTDQIVLASRLGWGSKPYSKKPTTLATDLNKPLKTVQKSITKLKRLGYWPDSTTPARGGSVPARGGNIPSRGGGLPTGEGEMPSRGGDKKSFSPMKTDLLLDSSLDNKLDRNKIAGLDSAAGAAALSSSPQTVLKKLGEENSVTPETPKTKNSGSGTTEGEALNGIESKDTVPVGPDGRPMTKEAMAAANFLAEFTGKPLPFTEAQMMAGREPDAQDWQVNAADEFAELFERRAG